MVCIRELFNCAVISSRIDASPNNFAHIEFPLLHSQEEEQHAAQPPVEEPGEPLAQGEDHPISSNFTPMTARDCRLHPLLFWWPV